MYNIKFKPKFEAKLKELGVREKFIDNLVTQKKGDEFQKTMDVLDNEVEEFHSFINYAFVWSYTPQNHSFWAEIASYDL